MTEPRGDKAKRLTPYTINRLAVEAMTHPRTVRRAYDGLRVQPLSRERIKVAARRLNLPDPPEAES